MNFYQKLVRHLGASKSSSRGKVLQNKQPAAALASFCELMSQLNSGQNLPFAQLIC